jgi:hypothetical protein
MKWQLALLAAVAAASSALGHFVYILPAADHKGIQVVFSDTLSPDENVAIDKIAATDLFVVDAGGKQTPLKLQKAEHALRATLTMPAPVLIGGVTEYGVAQSKHTGNIPVLLKYYPKAVVGDLTAVSELRLDKRVPFEIIARARDNKLEFLAMRAGKPVSEADCMVLLPGKPKAQRSKTSPDGQVPGRFDKLGRYGVWVKLIDNTPGEWKGKKYDKAHSYATLVVDFGSAGK